MGHAAELRMGTRGSALARGQSGQVAAALGDAAGVGVTPVVVRTEGDDLRVPLDSPTRPGVFVTRLRDSLAAGEVDFVVHSFKDLPSAPAPGLVVAAIPARQDPRDAVVARDGLQLDQLPAGARIGTSSPRRAAALRRTHPQLVVVPLRGNVDTRLGRVAAGDLDAVVLALAGLTRMGRAGEATQVLGEQAMIPAPAQGALAVECRAADEQLVALLAVLDDYATRVAVVAERSVLAGVAAACTTAIGALARLHPAGDRPGVGELHLAAELSGHRGVDYARTEARVSLATPGPRHPSSSVTSPMGARSRPVPEVRPEAAHEALAVALRVAHQLGSDVARELLAR